MTQKRLCPAPLHTLAAVLAILSSAAAPASLGPFEHGYGIPSMGMAGVAYGFARDTSALGANPAHAGTLGTRADIGVSLIDPDANGEITGNAAGPDSVHLTRPVTLPVPQLGAAFDLGERWSAGATFQSAGVGPEYRSNPFQRFGGGPTARLTLGQIGLVGVLAFRPAPGHHVGASVSVGYQTVAVEGLQGFTAPEGTPANASVAPEAVTDRGTDGAFGANVAVGWHGRITDWLSAGAAYRSPTWTQKHDRYRGLLPEGGRLQLPAIYGAGIALQPLSSVTIAIDLQRFVFSDQKAFGNGIARLVDGNRLGSSNGPGFGWRDVNALKIGVEWRATQQLALRAGYIDSRQPVRAGETLFAFLGPVMSTTHYTAGASYRFGPWTVSGYWTYVPHETIRGEDSIPAQLGGGEADVGYHAKQAGLSLGRRFGGSR